MGGLIAYGIACSLRNTGKEVKMVALMSTSAQWVELSPVQKLNYIFDNVVFHAKNVLTTDNKGKYLFLKERTAEAFRRLYRLLNVMKSSLLHGIKMRKQHPLAIMERINDAAALKYQPPSFDGTITLFKPRGAEKYAVNNAWGWDSVKTGKLDIIQLNGYLNGILVEPYVVQLAEELRKMIDSASD
jgi:thioesterase domain-containing protein